MTRDQRRSQLEHMEMVLFRMKQDINKYQLELERLKREEYGDNYGNGKLKAEAYTAETYQGV